MDLIVLPAFRILLMLRIAFPLLVPLVLVLIVELRLEILLVFMALEIEVKTRTKIKVSKIRNFIVVRPPEGTNYNCNSFIILGY